MVAVHEPDVVILDLHMPDWAASRVLERLRSRAPETKVLS